MRRNFADVLREAKVDIKREYKRLFGLLYYPQEEDYYHSSSLYEEINDSFLNLWFRGTALSLDDFNDEYGFHFEESPGDFDLVYLVRFCEYFYNLVVGSQTDPTFYIQQILRVIERIGYAQSSQDGYTIFVEKDAAAISVSEKIPADLSYKVIEYNHHSMKGDVTGKKVILKLLADQLEPREKELKRIDGQFKNDLFNAFNNLDIRHNNTDQKDSGNYRKYVAEMDKAELEKWYDEIYQMCLLAFMRLEHTARKPKFDELMRKVNEIEEQ